MRGPIIRLLVSMRILIYAVFTTSHGWIFSVIFFSWRSFSIAEKPNSIYSHKLTSLVLTGINVLLLGVMLTVVWTSLVFYLS
jgi:hypothetical protein